MIINRLTMTDYCVFQGTHTIDLKPRAIDGKERPIILFGGLNGTGKTTTLSAIRLALYGMRSIGRNISKRVYHEHLMECVHLPASTKERPTSSSIELEFEHGDKGVASTYSVLRQWNVDGEKVEDNLSISKDGAHLQELSHEQCQAFLNELVPVGVSDLFFFDGEKIADLAEEEGSTALQGAINRLMGVDIIHRLRSDLEIYLKEQGLMDLPEAQRDEIAKLEGQYQTKRQEYEVLKAEKESLEDQNSLLTAEINTTERLIDERGGAWAASRKSEIGKVETLLKERDELEEKIRHTLSGVAPLLMAKRSSRNLLKTLGIEQETKRQMIVKDALFAQLKILKKNLAQAGVSSNEQDISNAVDRTFSDLFETSGGEVLHDLSESDFANIQHTIETVVPDQEALLKKLVSRLSTIEEQLELSSRNVERTPDTAFLKNEIDRLKDETKKQVELEYAIKTKLNNVKSALRESMDLLRQLRRLDEDLSKTKGRSLAVDYAEKARELLREFAERATANKVKRLEAEFVRAFQKLARKDDISLDASIDPQSFSVTLRDAHGNVIKKRQLSAGEKQIYAIAMLEALGRTTGRNLPIIIDTPLGRLDSKHRNKLVHNYFSMASHQVIILSTDTEIDEDFFVDLQDDISHGYEITYDSDNRCSALVEGYFWKQPLKKVV